jgi:hypothetical protein
MPRSTVQINLRVKPDLREQIEQAAEVRGVSVTEEINDRLRRSLEDCIGIQDKSPPPNKLARGVLTVVEEVMNAAGESALFNQSQSWAIARTKNWVNDPTAYHIATQAAAEVFKAFAPPGEREVDQPAGPWDALFFAEFFLKQAATGEGNVDEARPFAQRLRTAIGDELAGRIADLSGINPKEAARERFSKLRES